MANQSHFDLQMFAAGDESKPELSLADILGGIEESPIDYDALDLPDFDDAPGAEEEPVEDEGADEPEEEEEPDTPGEADEDGGAEEYDEIIYNKEKIRIPVSERQALLQKGYNYDKAHGRLTEAEQKAKEIDRWVEQNYRDHGIKTWEQFQNTIAEQKRKEQLEEMGLDEDGYKKLLENDPDLLRLRQEADSLRKQTEEQAISQRLQSEVEGLNAAYDLRLQSIDDVLTLPNAERIIEIARTSGLPLTDCYLLANKDEVLQKQAKAAEQRARTKVASKAHVKDAAKASDSVDLVQVPEDVYRMYKALNPDATRRQIAEHYAKSLKD